MILPAELDQILKIPWGAELPQWSKKDIKGVVKKVFLLEIPQITDDSKTCQNCHGTRSIYAFLALGGPYENVHNGLYIASKWIDGGWWYGYTNAYPCPVCSQDAIDHLLNYEPVTDEELEKTAYEDWTK